MSFWDNNKALLLAYRNMPQQTLTQNVDILLTPQFYTLKKEPLPLKYTFQVKKIAPSLFEGLLDNDSDYEYLVYKENENWVFIAYDLAKITAFLLSKGIKAEQIGKLFFAQQALSSFTAPVLCGSRDALMVIDHTVTLIPQSALPAHSKLIELNESFTPRKGVAFQGTFNSFVSRKQAIWLATLLTLFALAFFAEGRRDGQSADNTQKEIKALIKEYPVLQSAYKRKSIAEKYRAIDSSERHKRDIVKALAGLLFKGVDVEYFKIDNKAYRVHFKCSDAKVAKRLQELSKKMDFKTVKILTGNMVQIEDKI